MKYVLIMGIGVVGGIYLTLNNPDMGLTILNYATVGFMKIRTFLGV